MRGTEVYVALGARWGVGTGSVLPAIRPWNDAILLGSIRRPREKSHVTSNAGRHAAGPDYIPQGRWAGSAHQRG